MGDYYTDQAEANRAWETADPATRSSDGATAIDPGRTRWITDINQINAYLRSVRNDPAFKLAVSRGEAGIESFLHERGYGIVPTEAKYDVESGEVKDKNWWDKNKHWAIPAMVMGGAIAAPVAAGALAGGGAPTAASGAVLPATVTGQAMSTLPAGASILGTTAGTTAATEAAAGGSILGRALTRDNILDGAGIVAGGIDAYNRNERSEDEIELARQRLQLQERELGQQNDQFGASHTRSNEQFGFSQGQNDRQFGANILQGNEQFGASHALRSKQFELDAPAQRLTTGVRGSMVANQSPVKAEWGGPGSGLSGGKVNFTGGHANPNLISADARALGNDVTHQALLSQLKHDDKVDYNPTNYTPGAGFTGTPYSPSQRPPILDVPPVPPGRRRTPNSILDPDNPETAILRGT